MDSHKLLRDVLKEIERGWYHPPPPQISDGQYENINWIEFESDEDHSSNLFFKSTTIV